MSFRTALLLAAGLHGLGLLLLWHTWPEPAVPEGEVVPLELRSAESAPAAAAPAAAPARAPVVAKTARHTTQPVVTLQPEPGGDVPVAPAAPEPASANLGGAPGGTGVAAGSGAVKSGAGTGGAGGGGSSLAVDHGPLKAQAMERIRQQRRYPELARRRRIEGTVVVSFHIAADGGVTGLRVKKGVDEMLDQAALDAVRAAAPLPAALSTDGELEVPFQFYLRP